MLVLGGMAGCIGLAVVALYALNRQRLYAWLGLMGIFEAAYCFASFRMYSAETLQEGARWQFWQLVVSVLLVDATVLTGFEYLGELRRWVRIAIGVLTAGTLGPMWIPGLALADHPAVKVIPWLGVRYYEMQLGLALLAFYVVGILCMGYIAVKLAMRSVRGNRRDRIMTAAYGLWWIAGFNDMMVSAGVYTFIYLVEFSFFIIVAVLALLVLRAQHRRGLEAEQERSRLALEVLAKDRDLAAAQAELVEAAKLAAVGRLAAGVAHEVNNPLAYVLVNLQLLEADLDKNSAHRPLVREALQGVERIRTVVRQLSSFSRAAPLAQSGDVQSAVDAAIKMAMVELKDRARVEVSAHERCRIQMDEDQLAQVLLNLLVNAGQSIQQGHRDDNLVRLEVRAVEGTVEIAVQDTGCGIPDGDLPHIFEPFYTTKVDGEGQGLGLAISRELVSKAGGRLTVENVRPHGARFTIVLPVETRAEAPAPAEPQQSTQEVSQQAPVERRRRALVVDDEKLVVGVVKRVLEREDFEVRVEHSGRAALQVLAEDGAFDVVLCDLNMPDGAGLDVLHGIEKDHPELVGRMIFMTGVSRDPSQGPVAGNSSIPVLTKPFSMKELGETMRRVLDGAPPENR